MKTPLTWGEKRTIDKYEEIIRAVNAKLLSPDVMNEDWFLDLQEEYLIIKNGESSKIQQEET